MSEVMVFPDVEAALVGYLTAELARRGQPATVATHVPDPRPDRLVKVTRTGGPQRDHITDLPQVTFECWATDEIEASELARLARALVWLTTTTAVDTPDGPMWVRHTAEVGGIAFNPDPETRLPRYQFTAQLDVRGQVITT